ncbi:hypothetical protein SERLA73DRAFT_191604, partial [Serpula lacrymans var. lacrymans S7.3]
MIHLEFVFDDYVLAAYRNGEVFIWDTRCLDFSSHGGECGNYIFAEGIYSCVTAVGAVNSTVFIGIISNSGRTAILSATIGPFLLTSSEEKASPAFQLITTMDTRIHDIHDFHDINVEAEMALLSRATEIYISNWRTQTCYKMLDFFTGQFTERVSIPTSSPLSRKLDDRSGYVRKLKFVWPYVLCLRSSSISVYDLRPFLESMDSSQLPQVPILVHKLRDLHFTDVSISNPWPQPIRSSVPSNHSKTYRMSLVCYDCGKGLYLYRIILDLSPTPSLSVNCIDTLSYATHGGDTL